MCRDSERRQNVSSRGLFFERGGGVGETGGRVGSRGDSGRRSVE